MLFSRQDQLPGWSPAQSTWSISALLLLLGFKGVAWSISLASFRGGPTFPSLFLGAAGGILASHLPGFDLAAAVAVGDGRRPGVRAEAPAVCRRDRDLVGRQLRRRVGPLIIVGVVVAHLTTLGLSQRQRRRLPVMQADATVTARSAAIRTGRQRRHARRRVTASIESRYRATAITASVAVDNATAAALSHITSGEESSS